MTKYSPEQKRAAETELREPHAAAKEVARRSSIAFLSLRYMAYDIAKELGRGPEKPIQHALDTEHGSLLLRCAAKLKAEGYEVILEQNEIRKAIERLGSSGNPDLLAVRGTERLLVEVVERTKGAATFVDQLERFSAAGKVLVVLPVDTNNLEFWGPKQLGGTES